MKVENTKSRRNFLRRAFFGLGIGIGGISLPSYQSDASVNTAKLPQNLCVATIDIKGLWPESTRELRIKEVLNRMSEIAGLKPDLICLPELFDSMWIDESLQVKEIAEDEKVPGPVASQIAEFAKKHNCYVVCPIYTHNNGHYYNSSLLIDRHGKIAGVYHKAHPTKSEILVNGTFGEGVSAGALNQQVIKTDFGKVGMLICYDANWVDGWDNLREQGANIILFSSAFPGGRILNHYALKNNCYVISSTGGDARIIDISGNDLDSSSTFVRYAWANINLDKVNLATWPTNNKLPAMFEKYGDKLGLKVWDANGAITMESNDPQLKVSDVLKEFNLQPYAEEIRIANDLQVKYRM